jgi:hypothetical protein
MKKFLVVLAVAVSSFGFGQDKIINDIVTEYESIRDRAGYFENPDFKKVPSVAFLLFDLITLQDLYKSQPQLDIVPVLVHSGSSFKDDNFISYFNKINFGRYLDTTKFEISTEIIDVVQCSTQNIDDPNLVVINIGYQESILVKNRTTGKGELLIDVFYLNQSSFIRGVNVFTTDRIVLN